MESGKPQFKSLQAKESQPLRPQCAHLYNGAHGGLAGGTVVKNPPASAGDAGDGGQFLGQECSSQEDIATHSSILARKTPWTEETSGLQSMGSQRVRRD